MMDPECLEYNDKRCAGTDTDRVCIKPSECNFDSECDVMHGFKCLKGDQGLGRCINYELPN